VGIGQQCSPIAESIGIAAVSEHLPKPDRSCTAAILFGFEYKSSSAFIYVLRNYNTHAAVQQTSPDVRPE
jgi:hypothetical protein